MPIDWTVDPVPDDVPTGKLKLPPPLPPGRRRTAARALAGVVIATPSLAILALTLAPRATVALAREATAPATPPPPVKTAAATVAAGAFTVAAEAERGLVHDPAEPVHVLVTVKGGPAPAQATRPPARVVLVVDRSGSMASGDKIGFARQAVVAFLRGLGPADACAVLAFDDQVERAIPWTPGQELQADDARVAAITARGGTDIAQALEAAEQLLVADARPGEARRIVLLTDGHDGSGRDLRELARRLTSKDITLSCHGFGTGLNAPLLASLAETGGGNFLFVDSGPRAVAAFETERDLALATVARALTVRLEPAAGVEIDEVVSWEAVRDGAARTVRVGDLPAGAERKVVARVRWGHGSREVDGGLPLLRVTCSADVERTPGSCLVGPLPVATLDVGVRYTADDAAARASARPHLAPKLAQARFALEMTEVQRRLASGDGAGARDAAKAAYERLAAHPAALADVRARSFVASDAAVIFFQTGELQLESAPCVLPSVLLPVGK